MGHERKTDAPRRLVWKAAEDRVLRDHYPCDGVAACLALLPGRTRAGVKSRVVVLRLRRSAKAISETQKRVQRALHPRPTPTPTELDGVIRAWTARREGARAP